MADISSKETFQKRYLPPKTGGESPKPGIDLEGNFLLIYEEGIMSGPIRIDPVIRDMANVGSENITRGEIQDFRLLSEIYRLRDESKGILDLLDKDE